MFDIYLMGIIPAILLVLLLAFLRPDHSLDRNCPTVGDLISVIPFGIGSWITVLVVISILILSLIMVIYDKYSGSIDSFWNRKICLNKKDESKKEM